MSFSTNFRARHGVGVENASKIRETVAKNDELSSPAVAAGHQQQIDVGVKAIESLCELHPDKQLVGSLAGHANTDGSGNVSVSYGFEAFPE